MRYINRNRFVRGNTGRSSQGGGGNLSVYSQTIQLTRSIDIIQVIDDTTIQIASDEAVLFPQGQVVLIEGSSDGEVSGINDGLYEVASIQVVGEDIMNISFTQANLTPEKKRVRTLRPLIKSGGKTTLTIGRLRFTI